MGSYFGTCGLTQLPIQEGEEVYLFLLEKSMYSKKIGSGFSNSDDLFRPISFPIAGVYEDRNIIIPSIQNDSFIWSHLQTVHKNAEKNERSGLPFLPPSFSTFSDWLETAYFKNGYVNGGYMLVHEKAFRLVVEEMSERRMYNERLAMRADLITSMEQIRPKISAAVRQATELKEIMEKKDEEWSQETYRELSLWLSKTRMDDQQYPDNPFVRFFNGKANLLKSLASSLLSIDNLHEERKMLIDFMIFHHAMNMMRKFWFPQSGAGSTVLEYYFPHLLSGFISEKERMVVLEREKERNDGDDQILDVLKDKADKHDAAKGDLWY